jgi:asparagine synthase (glutamine-hydrolysing)
MPAPALLTSHEPRGGRFAVEALIRDLTSGMHLYFLQSASRAASTAGIELRYPLLDVRLVEFCLAIPEDQRRRAGVQKSLLRRALGRDYPPEIATRTTKADFSHVVLEAFASLGSSFFEQPELARRGWIDARAVQRMLHRMETLRRQGDEHYGDDVPSLWAVTALELWMRAQAETVRRAPIIGSLTGMPAHG